MNIKLANAVMTLVGVTTHSNDFDSLKTQLIEHKDEVADALQFIGNADKESCVESAHYGLLATCPDEVEAHVMAVSNLYLHIINDGWENYEQNVAESLDKWLDIKDTEENDNKVQFLESCLNLDATWKF